ncbi:MAG: hypothetical protein ACRDNW_17960 [Trebonia sp.]
MEINLGLPSVPVLTLADVLREYGGRWQIEAAEFCYVAVRRPSPTVQEVVTGRDPAQLAAKLAAEEAVSDE